MCYIFNAFLLSFGYTFKYFRLSVINYAEGNRIYKVKDLDESEHNHLLPTV